MRNRIAIIFYFATFLFAGTACVLAERRIEFMDAQLFPRNSGAMLYPGMVRYEGIAAVFTLNDGEVIVVAPNFAALKKHATRMGVDFEVERGKCKVARVVPAPEVTITEPEPDDLAHQAGRDAYPDSPEGHEEAMIADEAADAMRNLPLVTPKS